MPNSEVSDVRAVKNDVSIPNDERVPLKEKLAYAMGYFGGGSQNYIINPVFVLHMGISPAVISIADMVYRVWDAITDMLVGWLSDRTRSRWGRRKPYLLIGGIMTAVWTPVLFLFDRGWDKTGIIAWMIAVQLLMFLWTTLWNIPYQCLLLESTPNSTERTNMAAWRGYVGQLSGIALSWVWWLTQLPVFNDSSGKPDILVGARWVMVGFGLVVVVTSLLPLLVKERTEMQGGQHISTLSLRQNLKLTFSSHSFVVLIFFSLLFGIGFYVTGGLKFYNLVSYVCKGNTELAASISGIAGTLGTVAGILGIALFQWIAKHRGKVFSLYCIMILSGLASVSTFVLYTPSFPYLSIIPGLLLSPCTTGIWVIIPSMLGDVVDEDAVRNYERREASFAATYSWTLKLSMSLASALSGLLVVWAGFVPELKTEQPANVLFNMRILLAVFPTIFILAAIWLLRTYKLTTAKIEEHQAILRARRQMTVPGAVDRGSA